MLVLWLIIVLGVVATAIAAASHADSTLTWNLRARATGRYAAESGIVVATRQLETLLLGAPSTEERARALQGVDRHFDGLRDVPVGSGRFGIAVVDLNARLDLNHSDAVMQRAFFTQFTDAASAERAVAALADWIDADDLKRPGGAEAPEYVAAGSPYLPRNAPLDRLDDLAHLLSVDDSLAAAVAPYVTVDGDGLVNVNSAQEPVLAALPGVGAAPARALIARRLAGETFTALDELRNMGPAFPRLAVIPSRLLIVSRGWLAGNPLTHEIQAVYGVAGNRLYLLAWRERDL
jgi:general secretion pathway protein K